MPSEPASHHQYWGYDALPGKMNHFVQASNGAMPYMDYWQFQPQYSFGTQGYKLPYLRQRDMPELPMNKKAVHRELLVNNADKTDRAEPRNKLHDKGLRSVVQTERDYFSGRPAKMARQGLTRESKRHSPRCSPHKYYKSIVGPITLPIPSNDHAEELNKTKNNVRSQIQVPDSERLNWSNKKRKSQTHQNSATF